VINIHNTKNLKKSFWQQHTDVFKYKSIFKTEYRYMNCAKCRHTHLIHKSNVTMGNDRFSLFNLGKCMVDGCSCTNYLDKIEVIDEDLL
jgi:hypothetical protein